MRAAHLWAVAAWVVCSVSAGWAEPLDGLEDLAEQELLTAAKLNERFNRLNAAVAALEGQVQTLQAENAALRGALQGLSFEVAAVEGEDAACAARGGQRMTVRRPAVGDEVEPVATALLVCNGAQGPQGEPGVQGPVGSEGPPGPLLPGLQGLAVIQDYEIELAADGSGDFETLQAALAHLNSHFIPPGREVTIQLADGLYNFAETLVIQLDQGRQVRIVGNQLNSEAVILAFPGAGVVVQSGLKELGRLTVRGPKDPENDVLGGDSVGVTVTDGAQVGLNQLRLERFEGSALLAQEGALVFADGLTVSGPPIYFGLNAIRSGTIVLRSAELNNVNRVFTATDQGRVLAYSSDEPEDGVYAIDAANVLSGVVEAQHGGFVRLSGGRFIGLETEQATVTATSGAQAHVFESRFDHIEGWVKASGGAVSVATYSSWVNGAPVPNATSMGAVIMSHNTGGPAVDATAMPEPSGAIQVTRPE